MSRSSHAPPDAEDCPQFRNRPGDPPCKPRLSAGRHDPAIAGLLIAGGAPPIDAQASHVAPRRSVRDTRPPSLSPRASAAALVAGGMGTTALSHDDRWWAVRADTADGPSGRRRSPSRRRRRRFLRAPTHRPPAVLPARPRPPLLRGRLARAAVARRPRRRRQPPAVPAAAHAVSHPRCLATRRPRAGVRGLAARGPVPSTRRREACARWPSSTLGTRSRAPTAGPMVADTVHPDVGPAALPVRGGPARLTVCASGASSIEADPCCVEDGVVDHRPAPSRPPNSSPARREVDVEPGRGDPGASLRRTGSTTC